MDMVHYKACDGLPIPAYLTLPPGGVKKNLPLLVFVHGGPWVRGATWGWDSEVRFLASRGYAVLQPEFRGNRGFGRRHLEAGFKQWGLAMQNDLADGVRWAIAEGIADPKRICIMGASYGGYATMMGLVHAPDLFRCGVNWVGVTDIDLMYGVGWSDLSDDYKRYGMPALVGDRVKDAAQFKATSPMARLPASPSRYCSPMAASTCACPSCTVKNYATRSGRATAMSSGSCTRKKGMAGTSRKTRSTSGPASRNFWIATCARPSNLARRC